MSKIKVPMRVNVEQVKSHPSVFNPFGPIDVLNIKLSMMPFAESFEIVPVDHSSEYINRAFKHFMKQFQQVDMQTLFAIHSMLKSARIDNAFDMLTLNKQLLPLLDEVIAQADPDNYELEIIK